MTRRPGYPKYTNLPGQLPYASDAAQDAFVAAATEAEAKSQTFLAAERVLRTARSELDHAKRRAKATREKLGPFERAARGFADDADLTASLKRDVEAGRAQLAAEDARVAQWNEKVAAAEKTYDDARDAADAADAKVDALKAVYA